MKLKNYSMKKFIFILLISPAVLLAEAKTHDGFFFQVFHSGFFNLIDGSFDGSLESDIDRSNISYEEDEGDKYSYGIKLGGALSPGWIIHVNFTTISYPDITGTETAMNGNMSYTEGNYTLDSIALGASYYILPGNIYISPELRLNTTSTTIVKGSESNIGLEAVSKGRGVGLTVGKEWWASNEWALGLSLFYSRDTLQRTNRYLIVNGHRIVNLLPNEKANFIHTHYGIIFTATYN